MSHPGYATWGSTLPWRLLFFVFFAVWHLGQLQMNGAWPFLSECRPGSLTQCNSVIQSKVSHAVGILNVHGLLSWTPLPISVPKKKTFSCPETAQKVDEGPQARVSLLSRYSFPALLQVLSLEPWGTRHQPSSLECTLWPYALACLLALLCCRRHTGMTLLTHCNVDSCNAIKILSSTHSFILFTNFFPCICCVRN